MGRDRRGRRGEPRQRQGTPRPDPRRADPAPPDGRRVTPEDIARARRAVPPSYGAERPPRAAPGRGQWGDDPGRGPSYDQRAGSWSDRASGYGDQPNQHPAPAYGAGRPGPGEYGSQDHYAAGAYRGTYRRSQEAPGWGDGRDRLADPIGHLPRAQHQPPARTKRRRGRRVLLALLTVVVLAAGGVGVWKFLDLTSGTGSGEEAAFDPPVQQPDQSTTTAPPVTEPPVPASGFATPGLLTFRGSATRSYYGEGPVPANPQVLWSYPGDGSGMCSESAVGEEVRQWCGSGWTGQPSVFEREGRTWVVFGAYDRKIHFVDYHTGEDIIPPFETGDIIKGSVTVDPDGLPLVYSGSRDNELHVIAIDRDVPTELWTLHADDVSPTMWNDDWDASPLVIDDYLYEGGENSQFHVVKLNRTTGDDGLVQVAPELVFNTPGWDEELTSSLASRANDLSIENSVAYVDGVVYFANSGGLVQGWDVSGLADGVEPTRVFRYWAGDDIDASIVVDDEGFLYVGIENERGNARAAEVGQLIKLDPRQPDDPLVWSVADPAGFWATPALHEDVVIAASDGGTVYGVDRETGATRWTFELPPPTWQSAVIIDDTLIQGDCEGGLHAYDVSDTTVAPPELWSVDLEGCIESTPAVWKGRLFVGTRGGLFYAIGDP